MALTFQRHFLFFKKKKFMRVLFTGGSGQLAACLKERVWKFSLSSILTFFAGHDDLDITDSEKVEKFFTENGQFDIIVNCAAYTNVESAEEHEDDARKVNVDGVRNLVEQCKKNGAWFIHISTDYVFDGEKSGPYFEDDETNPINAYGRTKRDGENEALKYEKSIIMRTSWLYSERGKNFFKTILQRLMDGKETRVVNDQIGTPTYAGDLADYIIRYIFSISQNIYTQSSATIVHAAPNGECSWYEFADAIETLYTLLYRAPKEIKLIKPCSSEEFPQKAKRPAHSKLGKSTRCVLENFEEDWIDGLIRCMKNNKQRKI